MTDPLEQSFDRFTMPGRIPDASDPAWRLPPVERDAVWRARGLLHPAGRGWEPVRGSSGPAPLPHSADGAAPSDDDEYAPRPAPGKGPGPRSDEHTSELQSP